VIDVGVYQPRWWSTYAQVADPRRAHQLQLHFRGAGDVYWTCNCVSVAAPGSTLKRPLGYLAGRPVQMVIHEYRMHLDTVEGRDVA
jgi:hypothetical protein